MPCTLISLTPCLIGVEEATLRTSDIGFFDVGSGTQENHLGALLSLSLHAQPLTTSW